MSLDFNVSKKNIISSIQKYNIDNGYEKTDVCTQKEFILNSIPENLRNKYFYHFTHIENLESILKNGLLSTNEKIRRGISHTNIANESIQDRRSNMNITCKPYGMVHDYVPFYFTTINPMLLGLVNQKNIDQPLIIFFAISIEKILENNVIFTDASANTSQPPNFYNDPNNLNKLDWTAIDKIAWKSASDDERHKRMAEVLVYKEVPLDWIETIIVYNKTIKNIVVKQFNDLDITIPDITYEPFNGRYFYFKKFFFNDRRNETLVMGPNLLKCKFDTLFKNILGNRQTITSPKFQNIEDAITNIENDFCIIEELEGIYQLETINEVHSENVSDHTLKVVTNLEVSNDYYSNLSENDKQIVKFSAYLHDIGKGPKSKWKDGKQQAYADHPADAIPMLERILSEDFESLSKYEIRKICLLVVYHDLIGDIIGKGRSKKELFNLIKDENELNMLIAISLADVLAIDPSWYMNIFFKIPNLKEKLQEKF